MTFRTVVSTVAARSGLYADFSPKPIKNKSGNGMHINVSAKADDGRDVMPEVIAGLLKRASETAAFFNITEESYRRLGENKAPKYVSWSSQNRSELIRIPAAAGEYKRAEYRSPDPLCNPYIAFALIIKAGLDGIKNGDKLPPPTDINLYTADSKATELLEILPENSEQAKRIAAQSRFVSENIPEAIRKNYII